MKKIKTLLNMELWRCTHTWKKTLKNMYLEENKLKWVEVHLVSKQNVEICNRKYFNFLNLTNPLNLVSPCLATYQDMMYLNSSLISNLCCNKVQYVLPYI